MDRDEWELAGRLAHRLPAVAYAAGSTDLDQVLATIMGHLERGSDLRFRCTLAAILAFATRNELVGSVASPDGAAELHEVFIAELRALIAEGRSRGDELGLFGMATAAFNLIGVSISAGQGDVTVEARDRLAEAVELVGPGDTTAFTSHLLGMGGLIPAAWDGDVARSLGLLRRASGLDGGFRNDDYLALYADFLLVSGDPRACQYGRAAQGGVAYGFGRIAALTAIAVGEAETGNLDVAVDELAAAAPAFERVGAGMRAGFVVAAACVARMDGDPGRAARWIAATHAVGPEKGPHVRLAVEWQLGILLGELGPESLDEAITAGRATPIDAAFDEVVAWLHEPRAT